MMKSIWTTIIAMICAISCFSQDCRTTYNDIKKSSSKKFERLDSLKKVMNSIDKHIELISKKQDSCKINKHQWNIIRNGWKEFKTELTEYEGIAALQRNHADIEKIQRNWTQFRTLIHNSEEQLFVLNDNTLIQEIKKVNTLVKDSTSELIKKATALRNTVINKSNEVKEIIQGTVVKNQEKIISNSDSIKYFLYKRDTTIINSINLHGYDKNIYGLSYLQVFKPKNKSALNAFAALAEIITSFRSFKLRNTGAFLSAGVQHRSMVLLAGLGYFDNEQAYNISWKASFVYFPHQSRFGFGASYSPLTKAGIVVGFKLN